MTLHSCKALFNHLSPLSPGRPQRIHHVLYSLYTTPYSIIKSPVDHTLHIVSLGWSPSTSPGGVTGKIIYLKELTPIKIDEQKAELAGAIVLFDDASLGAQPKFDVIFSALYHLRSLAPMASPLGSRTALNP
jgi:hypothetical protein